MRVRWSRTRGRRYCVSTTGAARVPLIVVLDAAVVAVWVGVSVLVFWWSGNLELERSIAANGPRNHSGRAVAGDFAVGNGDGALRDLAVASPAIEVAQRRAGELGQRAANPAPMQSAFGRAAEGGCGGTAHGEVARQIDGARAPVFFKQLRELRGADASELHGCVVAGRGAEIDCAGGVERAAERAAIERRHLEVAIAQGEIGGGVGDFELSQSEAGNVDGAVEQRPVLAAGANAVEQLLHHAFILTT